MPINYHYYIKQILKYISVFIASIIHSIGLLFLFVYVGFLLDKNVLGSIRNEEASLVFSVDNILIGKCFAENRTNISMEEVLTYLKMF